MLARFVPPRDLMELNKPFNRIFDFIQNGSYRVDHPVPVDLVETRHGWLVKASLPGIQAKDIEVTVHNGFLTVQARSEKTIERSGWGGRVREHRRQVCQRSLRLPAEVNAAQAEARLQYGVLTVFLPRQDARSRLIQWIRRNTPNLNLPFFQKRSAKIRISHP